MAYTAIATCTKGCGWKRFFSSDVSQEQADVIAGFASTCHEAYDCPLRKSLNPGPT